MCICMDWLEWTNKKSFRPGRLQSKWANKLCHKDQKVQTNCGGKVTNFTISEAVKEFQDFVNLQKFVKVMNGQWLSVLNRAKLETEFWRLKQAEGKKITNVSSDNLSTKKVWQVFDVWCLSKVKHINVVPYHLELQHNLKAGYFISLWHW